MNLMTPFDRSTVSPLEESFSGHILVPGDEGFETARRTHNGMIDRRPAVIARCIVNADVVDALAFAIEHDLEIAVRGGGFGFLMGRYGYTIDNLLSVEPITANGDVVRASDAENQELFWGLRGGGGNFGIATDFEFALHPVGPTVQGGMIAYPIDAAREVLEFYRDLTADLADELTIAASLTHTPDGSGTKLAAILAGHCGPPGDASSALKQIKDFGTPVVDNLGPLSYTALNQILDPGFPKLAFNYWKSCFVDELSDDVIGIFDDQFARCPSPMSKLIVEHFHGAALRPDPSATAFPHRNAGYSILIISQWRGAEHNEPNIAWARETYDRLAPYTRDGAYSNYMDDDESMARVRQAFGDNFPRLRRLKDCYDPTNLFRGNQNIPPS